MSNFGSTRPVGYVVPDPIHAPLFVICPVFNPLRWQSRWKHFERFAAHVANSGAVLYTVEVTFGDRAPAVAHCARDGEVGWQFREEMIRHNRWIVLNASQEIWFKENAINIGVQHLPTDWKYVAWVDGDVQFLRPNWVGETIHQLQHYKFLQMFGLAHDLDSDYEMLNTRPSFVKAYQSGELADLVKGRKDYYGYGSGGLGAWSGLAWACTRDAWNAVGGLMDFCITGAADWYMAWALIGQVEHYIPKGSHPAFVDMILDWQRLAEKHIRHNVGHMTGSCAHYWHGSKANRKYVQRSNLLADLQFDPRHDLKRDWQGLPILRDDGSARYMQLRDGIMAWARQRNEDSPS